MIACPRCRSVIDSGQISFKDECPACHTDLHVCIYCYFFDEGRANKCREPQADYVRERDRANFCEFFRFDESRGAKSSGKDKAAKLWDELFKKK